LGWEYILISESTKLTRTWTGVETEFFSSPEQRMMQNTLILEQIFTVYDA
jgi:hypothetical protein